VSLRDLWQSRIESPLLEYEGTGPEKVAQYKGTGPEKVALNCLFSRDFVRLSPLRLI